MSESKPTSSRGPEFCNPLQFSILPCVREYASYLEASCCTNERAGDRTLTVRDRQSVLHDTDVGTGSNVGWTVVDVARMCPVVSVLWLTVPLFAATRRSKMKWICRRLWSVSMDSWY